MTTESSPQVSSDGAPSAAVHSGDAADALVGTIVAGTYRVDRLLGVGGMGAVYQATHTLMRRRVALKVLHREMASVPEVIGRFEREAVAAARVNHPNVAAALDFGCLPDSTPYLVMEYIEGRTLRGALADGALPIDDVRRIGAQTAAALAAAHAAGIVHRDLKPENVMLRSRPGEEELVKLLDLGIAKVPMEQTGGPALTRAGTILGTPQYMAPEQALGGQVDHRLDLYALGVVLYEMVAGQPPFPGDDPMAQITRHLTQAPPPLPATVPSDMLALIMQLLEKRADARPQSALEVAERLLELPADSASLMATVPAPAEQPHVTRRPPVTAKRFSFKRHRVILGLGACAVLSCLALMILVDKTPAAEESGTGTRDVASSRSAISVGKGPHAGTQTSAAVPIPSQLPSADDEQPPPQPSEVKTSPREPPAAPGRAPAAKKAEPKKESKRRTGPGGIYIPPPKDWF